MVKPDAVLLSALMAEWVSIAAEYDCELKDIHQDSREVSQGSLFIALSGLTHDGTSFIGDAVQSGASAVLTEGKVAGVSRQNGILTVVVPGLAQQVGFIASRFFGDVTSKIKLVGITGTNGKSSVTHFIAQLAENLGLKSAVIGTLGYGSLQALKDTGHTTPAPVALHRMLWELYTEGFNLVAMEVSSHALAQSRVEGIRFDVAVLTNITQDHLDYHGTMSDYSQAKRRLFDVPGLKTVIFNQDDQYGKEWLSESFEATVLSYSIKENATVYAEILNHTDDGITIALQFRGMNSQVKLPLLGDFNVSNYLAAFSALTAIDLTSESIIAASHSLTSVTGRLELVTLESGPKVVIDYAHTPDALAQTLKALRLHCQGRLWCVFGCGGDRDPGKRAQMGAIASRLSEQVVVTDDNPRSEDPDSIAQAIVAGAIPGALIEIVRPREKAILQVLQNASLEDCVLIAGKGHETYQEIQGVKYTFSDHSMVEACWHAVVDRKAMTLIREAGAQ